MVTLIRRLLVRVDDVRFAGIDIVVLQDEHLLAEVEKWRPQGRLLKLVFTTSTEVRELAQRYELNVRADVYQCGNRDHLVAKVPHVFDQQGAIRTAAPKKSSPSSGRLWIYIVDKWELRTDIETGKATIPAYDLASNPVDICVQLHGYNMARQGFSSNVITISGDQFSKVLTSTP
jgi:hypothetical protein